MSLRIDFNAPSVLRKGLEIKKGMTGTGQALKKRRMGTKWQKKNIYIFILGLSIN